jgi:predicted DsbA family dithiol-disulfide isomerase
MAAAVCITEFTDPGCPWAYSAEPVRARLRWLYGGHIDFEARMVVLSESPQDYLDKGFTPDKMAAAFKQIARDYGMPIDTSERPRMAATLPACRAVVAARVHSDRGWFLLRALRVRHFSGQLLDEPATIEGAARDAGIDPDELGRWTQEEAVRHELREDMALAREPLPAARVLDEKLANWSGGRRYTCPSYEIVRRSDGVRIAVPGFQPFAAYDVVTANLVPDMPRREPPADVLEVLDWALVPIATKEVAAIMDIELLEARERLVRAGAREHAMGTDGFWTSPDLDVADA